MTVYVDLFYCNNIGKVSGERGPGEGVEEIPEPIKLYLKNKLKKTIKLSFLWCPSDCCSQCVLDLEYHPLTNSIC